MARKKGNSRNEQIGTRMFFGRNRHLIERAVYYLNLIKRMEVREGDMFVAGSIGAPCLPITTATNSRRTEFEKVLSRFEAALEWKIKQLGIPAPGGEDQNTL